MERKFNLKKRREDVSTSFKIEELEPRLLLSADALGGLFVDDVFQTEPAANILVDANLEPANQAAITAEIDDALLELVFVDPATPDYRDIVDDLLAQRKEGRRLEIIVLDPNRDGITQITETLADYKGVDAVHILSHGSDGTVNLGSTQLTRDNLEDFETQFDDWRGALSLDADILIYGCDVASTSDGAGFVDLLSRLTGADVAASDDLTGAVALGGDWDLEYRAGEIETSIAVTESFQMSYQGVLAAADDTFSTSEGTTLTVAPTTTNLVDWWRFDEGGSSQTAADATAPANDGTLGDTTGIDSNDPTWTTGRVGSAGLSFDGNDDIVGTSSDVLKTASSFTLSAWFQSDTTTEENHILWQGYDGGNGYGDQGVNDPSSAEMGLLVGGLGLPNKIVFFLGYDLEQNGNGADPIYVISDADFTDTTAWHHVAVTVEDQGGGVFSASLYVDGVLEGTETGIQNDRTAWGSLSIGNTGLDQREFEGDIDEVRIYDAALSASELATIYQAGVLANDTITAPGDILDAILVAGPSDGTLSLNRDGSFEYTPNPGFTGADSFTYRSNDGTADSNTATVTITVNAINAAPSGSGSLTAASLNDNAGATALFGGLSVVDPDSGENDLSLRITLSDATAGAISGGGFSETGVGTGIYVSSEHTVDTANTALDAVAFTPTDNTGSAGTFTTD
ncbi:MAG: DUF4347 domain-containing protein, partial [Congregibacter sp.]